mmetsp:Transcript_33011/g.48459  ORF Transcript_33011/g.48459 Transcript_33011/m.48459 type:complete len:83 (+) Transcript_33011:192-440(+)
MLIHGAPEDEGKKLTFLESLVGPGLLLIVFVVSLVIFHNAPHSKSNHKKITLPSRNRPMHQMHQQQPPEPTKINLDNDGNEF